MRCFSHYDGSVNCELCARFQDGMSESCKKTHEELEEKKKYIREKEKNCVYSYSEVHDREEYFYCNKDGNRMGKYCRPTKDCHL